MDEGTALFSLPPAPEDHQDIIPTQNVKDKPYVCKWTGGPKEHHPDPCTKRFNRKSDLIRHMRIHTNTRPFKCSHCTKSFIQRSALTVHIRTHTGEKPHRCDHEGCEKAFSDSSSLARHRRIHTNNKPFKCPEDSCQKTFARKTTALKHANTHANTHETPNANNHANTHHMDGGPVPMYDFQQNPEFVAFPLQQNHEFGGFQPVQQNHEFSGFPPPLQQNQEFLDLPSMYNSPPSQFQIPNSIYIPREPEAQLPTTMCMEREIQAQLPVTIYEILRDNMSHGFQSHSPTEKSIVENNLSLHMGMCQTNDDNFQNADGSSPSDLTSNYSSNQDNMNVPQETGNFFQKFPGLYPNIGPNMQPMGAFNPTFGLPGGLQVVKDGEADSGLPLPHMRLDLDGES